MSQHLHPVDPGGVEAARRQGLSAVEAENLAGLLALLADPLRARLVAALRATGELCVGDLALALDASDDAVSYGLRLLRTGGLVRRRREGRMGYYRLGHDAAAGVLSVALDHLRRLGPLHPEVTADDIDDP